MNNASEIHSLHRYFIWANRMKNHCIDTVREQGEPPSDGMELRIWLSAPFAYACYWFETLYVVIEGMQQLGLTNSTLTKLVNDGDNLQKLRRFRNGVYHFQTNYFDNRIKDFLTQSYTDWASDLHAELSQYFLDWFKSKGMKAQVLENTNERIRFILTTSSGEYELLLEAFDSDNPQDGEPSDPPKSPVDPGIES